MQLELKERERKKYGAGRGNIARGISNQSEEKEVLLASLPEAKSIPELGCTPLANTEG